ncbi:hypothetical protein GG344DRAFT_70428 [Lentinula edodes]|nr:hypothetical protein GG344DRAFT_70428 [Lentinula edodes]
MGVSLMNQATGISMNRALATGFTPSVHPYATTPAFNAWMLELNVGRGICRHIVRGETFRLLEPPATCQKLTYLLNPYEKQDIVGKDDSELSSCESDDEVPPSIIPLPLPNPPPSPASAYTLRKRCANASATSPSSRTSASKPASKALGKRAVVLEEGEEERRGCSEGGQQRGPNRRRTKRRRKHIIERGHTCPEALEGKIRASKPAFSHLVTESLPIASGAWVGMDSQFYGAKKENCPLSRQRTAGPGLLRRYSLRRRLPEGGGGNDPAHPSSSADYGLEHERNKT